MPTLRRSGSDSQVKRDEGFGFTGKPDLSPQTIQSCLGGKSKGEGPREVFCLRKQILLRVNAQNP